MSKQFLQTDYKKIDRSAKRKTRKDKRACIDKLTEKAEDAASRGDMRTLKLSGNFVRSGEGPIRTKLVQFTPPMKRRV